MTDETTLGATRRSLHGVAELLIAGPQHRSAGTIRMRVLPGGFGGVAVPVRVDGAELVWPDGIAALTGTFAELAEVARLDAGPPLGVYGDTSGVALDDPVEVDVAAAGVLTGWFALGDAALRAFAPTVEPVLWPEHFDLAVSVAEVNYGVSPGDAGHPLPYAYVGPWTPREGAFWNAPFGALRAADDVPDAEALAAFFAEGARLAE